MYLYAVINEIGVCCDFFESSTEINDSSYIRVEVADTDMLFRKKWDAETQAWVDVLPTEVPVENSRRLTHTDSDGVMHWMNDFINEVFQSASNGKTAIANAITGVDNSLIIPENPTFAQLAALIGQLGGLQSATGTKSEITTPNTISGETGFKPKLVLIYNFGSGTTNVNIGLYCSSELIGSQISDSIYGLGGTLTRYTYPFTITDNGFTFVNHGAATNLKWLALG